MADAPLQPPISPIAPNRPDHDPRTYALIGACLEVYNVAGCGFLEKGYQLALANELTRRGIPFEREVPLYMTYKGDVLDCTYIIDFVGLGEVLLEVKAVKQLGPIEEAQVLNYLKLSGCEVALLVNFGAASLEVRRFVNDVGR